MPLALFLNIRMMRALDAIGGIRMRKPFCWILVPSSDNIEKIKCFWAVVGLLASEGKDAMCKITTQETLSSMSHDDRCDEIVIVKTDNWDVDKDVLYARAWADQHNILVRTLPLSAFF